MGRNLETYRGFDIERDNAMRGAFTWTHPEYDGPEDDRYGWAWSVEGCREAVDEYIEERLPGQLTRERCGSCPELTTKCDADHNPQCSKHGGR